MTSTTYIILGIIAIISSIIFLIIGLKENDSFFICMTGFSVVIAVLFFSLSEGNKEREGKVLQVLITQDSCVQSLNEEGELVFVPTYCYLIVFEADDGEYRTYTTFENSYKEGDIIVYKYNKTKSITIND